MEPLVIVKVKVFLQSFVELDSIFKCPEIYAFVFHGQYGMFLGGSDLDTITNCSIPLTYISPQIEYQGGIVTDTMNWTPISGTFVATGNEKYLVLGNFRSDATTQTMVINPTYLPTLVTDLYIDDVSLVEMELPAFAGNDTSIWFGDSAFIGREPDVGIDYACQWYLLPNDSVPIDTIAGLWVKPNAPATYVVRQQLWCSGVKWDTVNIYFLTVGIEEDLLRNWKVFPNPSEGWLGFSGLPTETSFTVSFSDATGRVVFRQQIDNNYQKLQPDLPGGLYSVTVECKTSRATKRITIVR